LISSYFKNLVQIRFGDIENLDLNIIP
jgi:hypothetical protein